MSKTRRRVAFTHRTLVGAAFAALSVGAGCGSNSNPGNGAGAIAVAGSSAAGSSAADTSAVGAAVGTNSEPAASGVGGSAAPGAAGAATAVAAGSSGVTPAGGSGGADGSGDSDGGEAASLHLPWDWSGVVGTGQSLAVGDPGAARDTPDAAPRATTQPYQNLQLSTGSAAWPVDSNDAALSLIPLNEPIGRLAPTYPSSWPTNIAGETPHTAMGNQTVALATAFGRANFVAVHGEVGENGQCLSFLVKGAAPMGVNGHAYEATLIETRAITRLAQAAGKTYGVGAITVTHGECDAGNAQYAEQLHQLWADYSVDLPAITGQTEPPILIVSQQNSVNDRAASTLAQWQIGVDYPADAVCSGPKYQYPYSSDAIHMLVDGYEQLGEKYGQVYFERVVLDRPWQPLQPTSVERDGRVVSVHFHVPVPPLVWEESFQLPHQAALTEWSAGQGFELRAAGAPIGIASVVIVDDSVRITAATDLPPSEVLVAYAMTADPTPVAMAAPFAGTTRWGRLRDSDPFVGDTTGKVQPNFALAFELPVP